MSAAFPRCCCGSGEVVIMGIDTNSRLIWATYKDGGFTTRIITPTVGISKVNNRAGTYIAACKRDGKVSPKVLSQQPSSLYLYYHDWNPTTSSWESEIVTVNGVQIKATPVAFLLDNNNLPRAIYVTASNLFYYLYRTSEGTWVNSQINASDIQSNSFKCVIDRDNIFWAVLTRNTSPNSIHLWKEDGTLALVDNWSNSGLPAIACKDLDKYIGVSNSSLPYEFHVHYPNSPYYTMYSEAQYPSMCVAQNKLWIFGSRKQTYYFISAYSATLGTNTWGVTQLGTTSLNYACAPHVCVDSKDTIHLVYNDGASYSKYWQCVAGVWQKMGEFGGGCYYDNTMITYCK